MSRSLGLEKARLNVCRAGYQLLDLQDYSHRWREGSTCLDRSSFGATRTTVRCSNSLPTSKGLYRAEVIALDDFIKFNGKQVQGGRQMAPGRQGV